MFTSYLNRWGLTPDGEPIVTHSSRLLPVRQNAAPAILKIALAEEERNGAALMSWWNGEGAARVLAKDGNAILLERAEGKTSLAELTQMYGPAVRCKRFSSIWQIRSCINVSGL
jgi:streptomycin 6-kinase